MKIKFCLIYLFLFKCIFVFGQAPEIEWEKCYGGSNIEYPESIIHTTDGGYIIAGTSGSTDGDIADDTIGGWNFWVVKIDQIGLIEWQKTYGGSNQDFAESIKQTPDGGYIVVGSTQSNDGDVTGVHETYYGDCWVIKLNNDGSIQWQKCYGGSSTDKATDIELTDDGGYIIAGYSSSSDGDILHHYSSFDYWIIKINSDGEIEWEKSLGGTGSDYCEDIDIINGGYILTGYTASSDWDVFGGGWHGHWDCWITKLNSDGNIIWQKCLGGDSVDISYNIIETFDKGYVLCGTTISDNGDIEFLHGEYDAMVFKIDSAGNLQWQKCYGGSENENAFSIIQQPDSGFILIGTTESTDGDVISNFGMFDTWFIKTDSYGILEFQQNYGGTASDYGRDVVQLSDTTFIFLGSTESNDGNVIGCHGISDYWTVKLNSNCFKTQYYADYDHDGFGNSLFDSLSCAAINGFVSDSSDCNDLDSLINPLHSEICNNVDDNCNGENDEGLPMYIGYADSDADNFGDADNFINSCLDSIPGYIADSTDCDDTNPDIYWGAPEICNNLDDNCDGNIDEDIFYYTYFEDADHDDYGNINNDSIACALPEGYVENNTDCDDTNPSIYPGAPEILNGLDDNCDGEIDEGLEINNALLSAIKIYPNPATDQLFIETGLKENFEIEIFDARNRKILRQSANSNILIPIHYFPNGIYFLKITNEREMAVTKFIKN